MTNKKPQSTGRKIALLTAAAVLVLAGTAAWSYRREIRGRYLLWKQFENVGMNAEGYRDYRHRGTGILFVSLSGGEFFMGTSEEQADWLVREKPVIEEVLSMGFLGVKVGIKESFTRAIGREQPRHSVQLRPFLIAKYEVTESEWKKVMQTNPRSPKGEAHPVEFVSWNECQEFCEKSSLALPTEAQWEYACRAGTSTAFAFGNTLSPKQASFLTAKGGLGNVPKVAVSSYEPNEFGLYNMHGNVGEWCVDLYDAEFYKNPVAVRREPVATTSRETSGSRRVVRGGGAQLPAWYGRSAVRRGKRERARYFRIGFRPAWQAP